MRPFSEDTDPAAHEVYVRLLRERTAVQRLAMVARINEAADEMALARLRRQYPNEPERRLRMRLQSLKYGDDLMRAAFGWDPGTEGR
ncbi:MAG: hypothetical protein KC621_19880 [Myxococcales bacterium]|nr:hypothetical protein [Myxococcales bacterium]